MPVNKRIQKKLNTLQVTRMDKGADLQKHNSSKIKEYKEVDILPMQAKAIQMIVLGYDIEDAAKKTRIKKSDLEHLISSRGGEEFLRKTILAINSDAPVTKRDLISELLSRLYSANDRNAVSIIAQISKMMDFEQKEHQNINFVFSDEPWATKKTPTIDALDTVTIEQIDLDGTSEGK